MSEPYLYFVHRFNRSLQVTMRVQDQPPLPGAMLDIAFEWTGKMKRKFLPEYRRWVLVTNQLLADRWGQSILYCLGTHHDKTELWQFTPGQAPRLIEKLNVGIP